MFSCEPEEGCPPFSCRFLRERFFGSAGARVPVFFLTRWPRRPASARIQSCRALACLFSREEPRKLPRSPYQMSIGNESFGCLILQLAALHIANAGIVLTFVRI